MADETIIEQINKELENERQAQLDVIANAKKELAKENEKRLAKYQEILDKGINLLVSTGTLKNIFNDLLTQNLNGNDKKIISDALAAYDKLTELKNKLAEEKQKKQAAAEKARAAKESKKAGKEGGS